MLIFVRVLAASRNIQEYPSLPRKVDIASISMFPINSDSWIEIKVVKEPADKVSWVVDITPNRSFLQLFPTRMIESIDDGCIYLYMPPMTCFITVIYWLVEKSKHLAVHRRLATIGFEIMKYHPKELPTTPAS